MAFVVVAVRAVTWRADEPVAIGGVQRRLVTSISPIASLIAESYHRIGVGLEAGQRGVLVDAGRHRADVLHLSISVNGTCFWIPVLHCITTTGLGFRPERAVVIDRHAIPAVPVAVADEGIVVLNRITALV